MAHPYPLQSGDRSSDLSRRDASTSADRRPTQNEGLADQPGDNPAPQKGDPIYPLWRAGYAEPNPVMMAPFSVVNTAGDTSGEGTQEYGIDLCEYGDAYDPTAPIRTRTTPWRVDTDNDGSLN